MYEITINYRYSHKIFEKRKHPGKLNLVNSLPDYNSRLGNCSKSDSTCDNSLPLLINPIENKENINPGETTSSSKKQIVEGKSQIISSGMLIFNV